MTVRKHIRIGLSKEDAKRLEQAKAIAEHASGVSMSNSMFALGVLRHHFDKVDRSKNLLDDMKMASDILTDEDTL